MFLRILVKILELLQFVVMYLPSQSSTAALLKEEIKRTRKWGDLL